MGRGHKGGARDTERPHRHGQCRGFLAGRWATSVGIGRQDGQDMRCDYEGGSTHGRGPRELGSCRSVLTEQQAASVSSER